MRLGMINSPEDRLGIVSGWPTTRPEHRFSLPTPPFRGLLTGTFEQLIVYSGFVLVFFSAVAVASVMVLRWRRPELHLPFRVRCIPIPPWCLWLSQLGFCSTRFREDLSNRCWESPPCLWDCPSISTGGGSPVSHIRLSAAPTRC